MAPTRGSEKEKWDAGPGNQTTMETRSQDYEAALRAYRNRDWTGARALFDAIRDDPPSRVMSERCATLGANGTTADWDGVWTIETK